MFLKILLNTNIQLLNMPRILFWVNSLKLLLNFAKLKTCEISALCTILSMIFQPQWTGSAELPTAVPVPRNENWTSCEGQCSRPWPQFSPLFLLLLRVHWWAWLQMCPEETASKCGAGRETSEVSQCQAWRVIAFILYLLQVSTIKASLSNEAIPNTRRPLRVHVRK